MRRRRREAGLEGRRFEVESRAIQLDAAAGRVAVPISSSGSHGSDGVASSPEHHRDGRGAEVE